MLKRTYVGQELCSVARTLEIIGDRWTWLIIRDAFLGLSRFTEFQDSLGIAANVLDDRLSRLVAEGIFERELYGERPARYAYRLTQKGEDLFTALNALRQWGDRYLCEKPMRLLRVKGSGTPVLAALVALVTLITYIAWYTPSKRRTSLSTVIGAIPGALPPMIGWAGATGTLSIEAWLLFAIVFLWQMPHFLAIAWLYREDYARAGFPLLPVVEPDGQSTARQATAYATALLPVSLTPTLVGLSSGIYFTGALLLGCYLA